MNLPAETLQNLLNQTQTHPKIKQTLKLMTQTRQKITYHGLVSSSQTYLQLRGLANSDQQEFNYINKILHAKIIGVLGKIKRKQLTVRDLQQQVRHQEQQKMKEQNIINQEIVAQVEHVINNVDLPLSLFKRNDKYWYHDNPKTIEAKNYVYQRIKEDRQRKQRIRSQIIKKQTEKQRLERQEMEKRMKADQQRRLKQRQQIKNHIEQRKRRSQQRQKSIQQSQKYTTSLKPLFLKIQQHQQHAKLTALQQQKKRLSQVRKLNKSIDFTELQEHKNRMLQIQKQRQKQRQQKRIINEPLKVSFKSKYHTSMTARSRMSQYQTTKSLYQKKKQYETIIKNQFKPKIDQSLVQQMEQRLKLMKRKRVRKNPRIKQDNTQKDNEYDDDDQEEQKPQQTKKPDPVINNNVDDDDSDENQDDKPPPRIRGQDEDPDWKQRYELGVGYLQYVRNLKKKKKQQKNNEMRESRQTQNNSQIQKQKNFKTSDRYKDYLRQFVKTNRSTIDHIDTQRMKNQYNKSIIQNENRNDYKNLSKLENQTRIVEAKINREQELLKFRKMKNEQSIAKKVEIDNAVIETIKARLALMGN